MSEHINGKRTTINILCSIATLLVNLTISFWLSPYIIRTIGVEANGFVSLANNFVTYANLIVTALNAMAARFITIAYIQQDYKKANMYYNSVFWGNLIIVAVLLLPAVYLVVKLENFIEVPANILMDVKILFSLVFLSFFVRTGAPNYDCGTYITNRMDLSYVPTMVTSLLRCALLVSMFSIWIPHVWYVSLTSTLVGFITLGIAGHYTHKLTPELRVRWNPPVCSWNAIKELVGSGLWNSISTAGLMLTSSVDLLICNVYLGATLMGVLSLAKTIPNILTQLSESLRGAFGPELTILYAEGNMEQMHCRIRRIMKITSSILTVPTAGILVMGDIFYRLWVPTQNSKMLWLLTLFSMVNYVFSSGVVVLYGAFSITNKVKYNSIALLSGGALSTLITLGLLNCTKLGVFAVAGVSCIIGICRDIFFTVPVTTHLLGLKWYTFYPQVLQSVVSCAVDIGIGALVRQFIPVGTWFTFFLTCGVIAILGLGANMMIVLNKDERNYLISLFKRKILHK